MCNKIQSVASVKSTFYGKILAILFVCLISTSAIAQDIINTLAPGGKFIVKDASDNFLTVDGYNIAIGIYSLYSNTTGSGNIALGSWSLAGNTEGLYNVAIGLQSSEQNTTGY